MCGPVTCPSFSHDEKHVEVAGIYLSRKQYGALETLYIKSSGESRWPKPFTDASQSVAILFTDISLRTRVMELVAVTALIM